MHWTRLRKEKIKFNIYCAVLRAGGLMRSEKQESCSGSELQNSGALRNDNPCNPQGGGHFFNFVAPTTPLDLFTFCSPVSLVFLCVCQLVTALMWKRWAGGPISCRSTWHWMNEEFLVLNAAQHWGWIILTVVISQHDAVPPRLETLARTEGAKQKDILLFCGLSEDPPLKPQSHIINYSKNPL